MPEKTRTKDDDEDENDWYMTLNRYQTLASSSIVWVGLGKTWP